MTCLYRKEAESQATGYYSSREWYTGVYIIWQEAVQADKKIINTEEENVDKYHDLAFAI